MRPRSAHVTCTARLFEDSLHRPHPEPQMQHVEKHYQLPFPSHRIQTFHSTLHSVLPFPHLRLLQTLLSSFVFRLGGIGSALRQAPRVESSSVLFRVIVGMDRNPTSILTPFLNGASIPARRASNPNSNVRQYVSSKC